MSDFVAPLDDIRFSLDAVAELSAILELDGFDHVDSDLVDAMLGEAARICTEVIGPLNAVGDKSGSVLVDGQVRTPEGWSQAYEIFSAGGWGSLPIDMSFGGGGLPWLVANCVTEMVSGANMAFVACSILSQGSVDMLIAHGSETLQQTYLPKLVDGTWTGTMNLTEPDAGSDVGALRCRAERAADGTYRIFGTKIFITYGDHDLADNIVHLVLARTSDAPVGTKGISCFIVPKVLVNDDGTLGEENDVTCLSLEHKMGIHASPTAVMSFGDEDGAVGYLIGEENHGMRYMFTMMNVARLQVGLQAVGVAERAYRQAAQYAFDRRQGRAVGAAAGPSPIAEHADVARMLIDMRAHIEAMRGIAMLNAAAIDRESHASEPDEREAAAGRAALLTPINKGWCTDRSVAVTSTAIQVHGGLGFIEETGVAQHYRDTRITPIYEGTNGIQAIDLVTRKLPMGSGRVIGEFFDEIEQHVALLFGADIEVGPLGDNMTSALSSARMVTRWLTDTFGTDPNEVLAGATPFLDLMGLLSGGYVHVRRALAAPSGDAELVAARLATARFYGEQILPRVFSLVPMVMAGSETLFAIDEAAWSR